DGKFECVDNMLNVSRKTNQACGETPHLTSFALLLSNNDEEKCADKEVWFWAGLGLILGVCLLCVLFALAEWRIKCLRRMLRGEAGYQDAEYRSQIKKKKEKAKKEENKKRQEE